jgi:predicted kinase
MEQALYIFVGLPYAGKSTLITELEKRIGGEVVSADKFMEEKGLQSEKMAQEDWNTLYSEIYEVLKRKVQDGQTVLLDMANLKRSERDAAREIAASLNIPYKLIYINTPIEEIRRRRLENIETQHRGHLEDREMNVAFEMFEEPTADENPVVYNQEMDIEAWIRESNLDGEADNAPRDEIKFS